MGNSSSVATDSCAAIAKGAGFSIDALNPGIQRTADRLKVGGILAATAFAASIFTAAIDIGLARAQETAPPKKEESCEDFFEGIIFGIFEGLSGLDSDEFSDDAAVQAAKAALERAIDLARQDNARVAKLQAAAAQAQAKAAAAAAAVPQAQAAAATAQAAADAQRAALDDAAKSGKALPAGSVTAYQNAVAAAKQAQKQVQVAQQASKSAQLAAQNAQNAVNAMPAVLQGDANKVRQAEADVDKAIENARKKPGHRGQERALEEGSMRCPPPHKDIYVAFEAGGGSWNSTIADPSVNAGGFVGGGAIGFRVPPNGNPNTTLVWPVGARVGVLGGSFNSSTTTNGLTYAVKTPLAFYGEAEFANPIISSVAGSIIPRTMIYSSAGIAGVWQNYGWSTLGASGGANTAQFGFTSSIRAEWRISRAVDFYVQWRSFLTTPQQLTLPRPVTVGGFSNMVALGVQF